MTLEFKPLPMKEALAFWRDKVPLSPGEFSKLSAEVKTRAFAVSGIAKGDELSTVYEALSRALDQGITFEEFRRQAADVFERRGWTGDAAWRVDNIFRTNIQTAYNVGRYRQMADVARERPYWRYDAVNDSRTRPTHAALDGKVFPADHPFWDEWYPPNGFRCRCSVSTLSERQVKERGIQVESDVPQLIEPVAPLTGNRLPARPLIPDPGFSHHPGKTVWGGIVDGRLEGDGGLYKDLDNLRAASDYRRAGLQNVRPGDIPDIDETRLMKPGLSNAQYLAEFKKLYGDQRVLTDAAGDPVILSPRAFLADKRAGAPERWKFTKSGHGEIIPLLGEMIEKPFEIWLTPQKDAAGKVRLAKRYVGVWKTEDKSRLGGLAVFEVSGGVFQGVTAFSPLRKGEPDWSYIEKQRRGFLLYPGKGR